MEYPFPSNPEEIDCHRYHGRLSNAKFNHRGDLCSCDGIRTTLTNQSAPKSAHQVEVTS